MVIMNEREAGGTPSNQMKLPFMAIDLGEKRIGIAISDALGLTAKPHGIMKRKSRQEDFKRYLDIIEQKNVGLVVMGLPTYLDGSDSDQTRWVRDYSAEFQTHLTIPLIFQDEANSSQKALDSLIARGASRKKRQQPLDAIAAAIILQRYLDDTRNNG